MKYRIYPKYWDTDILIILVLKFEKIKFLLLPVDVSKIVLNEWQTE